MGRQFGNLAKVRRIITFSLSPFEQRAFPHFFSEALPNSWRRFKGAFFNVAPYAAMFYAIYTWGMNTHAKSKRKNPADYVNDV